jgi:hypothetical protein
MLLGDSEAEGRPYRGCRGGKTQQLKAARTEFRAAAANGDAARFSAAQADLSARAAACRAGPSGAGRRARGGGTGRCPPAASKTTAKKQRKQYKRRQRKEHRKQLQQKQRKQRR